MTGVEAERFLASCHRQQQELLSSLLDKVYCFFVSDSVLVKGVRGPSCGSTAELSTPADESAELPDANAKFSAL